MDNFERQIVTALESVPKICGDGASNSIWTHTIKKQLAELGENNNLLICTAGFEGIYEREWLYDFIWYKQNNENELDDVVLSMECEWSLQYEDIKYDFEKLLLSRSKYRVMIYQANSINAISEIENRLIVIIKKCKLSQLNDRYILAGIVIPENNFYFKEFMLE